MIEYTGHFSIFCGRSEKRIRLVIILLLYFTFLCNAQSTDTTIIIRNDTVIRLIKPGNLNIEEPQEGKKLEEILKDHSENNFFSRKLHEWLVKSSLNSDSLSQNKNYLQFSGKRIANIDIRNIPPFGGSVNDTTIVEDSWLVKMGNTLRFETAPQIVLKTLTFEAGQSLSQSDITDSERLLRSLSFINDAKIVAWPHAKNNDVVNISVYIQDRYPHAVSIGRENQQPSVSLINKNLFGRGISLSHTIVTPTTDIRDWGVRETFGTENFLGEYINFELDYSHIKNLQLISGNIEKNFVLPEIKYAGGASVNRSYVNPKLKDYPSIEWEPPLDYRRQNFWLGRSFLAGKPGHPLRSNFYITTRYLDLTLFGQPENQDFPPVGKFFFGGLSFSKRGYYKNNLIYSFGRTEDVPYGFLTSFNYGYHRGDGYTRNFLNFHHSMGKALVPSKGYVYLSADVGSFFKSGSPEQGHLKLVGEYITPLIKVGNSDLRNFFEIQYVNGLKRFPGEYLFLDEDVNGLHSFDYSESLRGSEKIVLKTEQVLFTNIEPLGFKFAAFTFFDTAFLKESSKSLFNHTPYFSFGGGLRIRNDNLVFNTLQIRLAIMPRVPSGEFPLSLRITGEKTRHFQDFVPAQPGTTVFY
ncbi:MAG: hypothetical protein PWR04_399 [Anaerophaga sp.]|nr:hypothetical protein [Anaerophaga sp.]